MKQCRIKYIKKISDEFINFLMKKRYRVFMVDCYIDKGTIHVKSVLVMVAKSGSAYPHHVAGSISLVALDPDLNYTVA
jgi:hypothetical protein